jgi:hypothetical protein
VDRQSTCWLTLSQPTDQDSVDRQRTLADNAFKDRPFKLLTLLILTVHPVDIHQQDDKKLLQACTSLHNLAKAVKAQEFDNSKSYVKNSARPVVGFLAKDLKLRKLTTSQDGRKSQDHNHYIDKYVKQNYYIY